MRYVDAVRAQEMPRVIRLRPNLHAACFTLMKLLPARYIVDDAVRSGALRDGMTIAESTSGTFGLGLAMVAALRGFPLVLVSDPVLGDGLRDRLWQLGAKVHVVPEPAPVGGYQQARLDKLAEVTAATPAFVPAQYDNPRNPAAYAAVAAMLTEELGRVDCLVGGVGSGGSMCGTGSALRSAHPDLRAVAVDTHGSVLFGHEDRPRLLRGLGNSIMPGNLDHTVVDEVHWVGAGEACMATRRLHSEHALFMGPTSGAAYLVAQWIAARHPEMSVVAMFADEGHRYQDTVGDPAWLASRGVPVPESVPWSPVTVTTPAEARSGWQRMEWARRPVATVRT
jgi:cysteine synthase